ncbi:MAG: hypothetical protein ABUK01_17970 [Leptospirales bacterium]
MRKKTAIIPLFVLLYLILSSSIVYPVMADRSFMVKALPENRSFIDFISVSVTNFGTGEHYDLLEEAYLFDYYANLEYLKGEYTNSHRKLLSSQKVLRDLYYDILTKIYEPDASNLLQMSAPVILLAKDKKGEYYLTNGYQHLDKAISIRLRGYNYNKFLYSNKIRFYRMAITEIRLAKKYALMALIESNTPIVDKDDYRLQSINEAKGVLEPTKITQYEKIKYGILNNISRKNLPDDFLFLLHHNDNYNYIFNNKESALTEITRRTRGNLIKPKTMNKTTPNNTDPGKTDPENTDNTATDDIKPDTDDSSSDDTTP